MHYYIDGYNVLFRLRHATEEFQREREAIIQNLNEKVALVNLDVSIVFDAAFQEGHGSRLRIDALEVLFTAHGETADAFIIEQMQHSMHPRRETVVTSDKLLAWHARSCGAHVETVDEFLGRLNNLYKNRLSKQKRKHIARTPSISIAVSEKADPAKAPLKPPKNASFEQCKIFYEHTFEAKWQEQLNKKPCWY